MEEIRYIGAVRARARGLVKDAQRFDITLDMSEALDRAAQQFGYADYESAQRALPSSYRPYGVKNAQPESSESPGRPARLAGEG